MKRSIVVLVLALLFPTAAHAQSFDAFNASWLSPDPATVSQTFTRSYDSAAYTFEAGFTTQERDRMGCGVGSNAFRFGSRTAWHRFEAGGPGTVRLSASSGYDVMLFAFKTTLPRGVNGFGNDVLTSLDCQDVRTGGAANESFTAPMRVAAGDTLLLATASACGTTSAGCNANAAGGATTLTVEFVADDRDGDGVADGADACPDVAAAGGCPATDPGPDADGDGVLIDRDRCPTVKGTTDDGCLDADGDGISDAADACAAVPGLGRDGCPQPLKATFSNLWTNFARGSRVERLQVRAPRGARVQWRCKGKGCKRRSASFSQRRSAESLLRFLARGRMLSRGAVIEVRVTAPMTLGTYTRFEIRGQRKNPRRTDRCITAAGALTRC